MSHQRCIIKSRKAKKLKTVLLYIGSLLGWVGFERSSPRHTHTAHAWPPPINRWIHELKLLFDRPGLNRPLDRSTQACLILRCLPIVGFRSMCSRTRPRRPGSLSINLAYVRTHVRSPALFLLGDACCWASNGPDDQ